MKNNDQQCPHTLQRLKALEKPVLLVKQKTADQLSPDVNEALEKLNRTVILAGELIKKIMEAHQLNQMVKSSDYKSEFDSLNKSLTDAFVTLSVALHVHQERMLEVQEIKLEEQEKKLGEQEIQLAKQERRLAEQEDKLTEQEDILQRVESKLDNESRAYYCVLQ
ncbi:putative golgin subfamily A member 6-like protein 3 [Lates japonicus]|uniref:Golgin subfamily A member 6-like protein 3 n=1 Tax=Lates japonicus TaxID=270547 RepID=A0AAD3R927_LATJO|nr:putative golgin subfamily A member 6-like protein 3 [Lates japonicus]